MGGIGAAGLFGVHGGEGGETGVGLGDVGGQDNGGSEVRKLRIC